MDSPCVRVRPLNSGLHAPHTNGHDVKPDLAATAAGSRSLPAWRADAELIELESWGGRMPCLLT